MRKDMLAHVSGERCLQRPAVRILINLQCLLQGHLPRGSYHHALTPNRPEPRHLLR